MTGEIGEGQGGQRGPFCRATSAVNQRKWGKGAESDSPPSEETFAPPRQCYSGIRVTSNGVSPVPDPLGSAGNTTV